MKEQNTNEIPFIHLYSTVSGYYLYDVNRNKFIQIPEKVYFFLENQQISGEENTREKSVESYIADLKRKGFLKSMRVEKVKHPRTDVLKYYLQNSIMHLVLQITQSCNLRCEYCIYSGEYRNRTHSNKQMSFEVAKSAIDYYIAHARDTGRLSIGFYGGEPCLNYKLIQECVAYMGDAAEGRGVDYSMTTNATLLNEENMDFFVKYDFNLLISLDGPEEIHDKHRKFAFSKEGSCQLVLQKVKYLKENYPTYCYKNVSFNMVIDTENTFLQLSEFVKNNTVISDLRFQTNVIDLKNTDKIHKVNPVYLEQINYERFKLFLELLRKIPSGNASKLLNDYDKELRQILYENDSLTMSLPDEGHHSGPCVPGSTRLFVTSDGIFYPCERVSENLEVSIIGNINSGIDLKKAEGVLNYGRKSALKCRDCWAYRYCDQCISHVDCDEQCTENYCQITRINLQEVMKDACTLVALGFDYALTENEIE